MPLNGYRYNPFDDADIDYLKLLYYKYFPYTYNPLLYIHNRNMTTKQVEKLCMNLIDWFWQDQTLSYLNNVELNKLTNISQRVQEAITYEKNMYIPKKTRPKSWPQQQFSQYNYRVAAQPKRLTFPPALKRKLSNMSEAERIKLASEYENKYLYAGVHPLDTFVAREEINKLLNQQYRGQDIRGAQSLHPMDEFRIKNIQNQPVTQYPHRRRYMYF